MEEIKILDIIIAVVLDLLIGDPYWFPHPVIYIGKLISLLEKTSRKLCKSNKQLKVSGLFIVIITGCISFGIPFLILKLAATYKVIFHIINILIIWTALAARSLDKEAMKVYYSMGNLEYARIKLSYIVGRDTKELSEHEIIRADVETVAENTSDGVIAPLLFAMIGGAPLAILYKAINTMDSMLGYKDEKYYYIGFFSAKTDDLVNLVPARITGILMCLCAPLVGGNIIESLKIMIRDRKNHKSPNCAYPEGAAAGAMRVQLGGTNKYFGKEVSKPTIGDCIKKLSKEHIKDSIKLMYAAEMLFLVIYIIDCLIRK